MRALVRWVVILLVAAAGVLAVAIPSSAAQADNGGNWSDTVTPAPTN